jgi:DnaJ-class molecular chaperone
MLKRACYEILGLPMPAHPAEIERAYRRILLSGHDLGEPPDSDRFRIANQAYETLRDLEMGHVLGGVTHRRSLSAEPPREKAPLNVPNDFLTVRPSIDELLDQFAQNFLSPRSKSGGPYRRLDIDAILEAEDARFGCRLPVRIRYFANGVEGSRQTTLEIPPGASDGQRYGLNLAGVGISNLLMQIRIVLH